MSGDVTYPAKLAEECRNLREGGWGPTAIRGFLAKDGQDPLPSVATICEWTDQHYRDRQRAMKREYKRRRRGERKPLPTSVLTRMNELRAAGVSYTGIGAVIGVDYGVLLTPEQTRYYVQQGREPVLPIRRARSVAA